MDKIMRRVRMAERQVARRKATQNRFRFGVLPKRERRLARRELNKEIGLQMNMAIKDRHEDWKLGPLAPRREVRIMDDVRLGWGTISPERVNLQGGLSNEEKDARCAWAGGHKFLCLEQGDRIVVVEGAFRGQIGVIDQINQDSAAIQLVEGAMANTVIPEFMTSEGSGMVTTAPSLIPISAVRLVHPMLDTATGQTRDVIIRELRPIDRSYDRPTRKWAWQRVAPNVNGNEGVVIPWPDLPEPKLETHAVDTARIDVEERTFVPTLLQPPMPEMVINELRNQYSKFRTRHTEEYVAQKEAEEEAKRARKLSVATMRTPLEEFNQKRKAELRARGPPELTNEMLEKIGSIIAKNMELGSASSQSAAESEDLRSAVEALSLDGKERAPDSQARPSQ